jgi:peptide chain release factor 1
MTLDPLNEEREEILKQLRDPELLSRPDELAELMKRKKFLDDIISLYEEQEKIEKEIKDSENIIASESNSELLSLAQEEIVLLEERKKEIDNLIKKKQGLEEEGGPAILEIRAGTGGDEASLFASDLFRMYTRYAQEKNWPVKILDERKNEVDGLKEVVFEISDEEAFPSLRHEGGVHRVQRVPTTEKSGRIHTSTASVAVLRKPKRGTFKLNPDEIRIEICKSSGPGGQNVNKRETAVRIVHIPTGLVSGSQSERSQAQNKENALAVLEAKVKEEIDRQKAEKLKKERQSQVGTADRSEKIRTYNFPQNRITDHRIKKSWHNIENIINGGLEDIIEELTQSD